MRLARLAAVIPAAFLILACGSPAQRSALAGGASDRVPAAVSPPAASQQADSSPKAESDKPTEDDNGASARRQGSQASSGPDAISVETLRVEVQTVEEEVFVNGELRANEEVELRAEENGRVVEIFFDEGERVSAGDLLVKINDADLQAELRRIAVQRQLAEQREQRTAALLAEQTISQEVYDEARGRLRMLEAETEQVHAEIAKTEVRAPFAGVIGLRAVSKGSYLTSAQSIATLQNLDPIKVDFAVPEKYAARLQSGDGIEFSIAGSENTYRGEVYAVEPRIDAETRTVQVRARAKNKGRHLLPGAFAEVRLVLGREDGALMVPSIALVPGLEATRLFVVKDGKAVMRDVRVGKRTAAEVQILEGLEPGDEVVISGVQQMRPGVAVAPR